MLIFWNADSSFLGMFEYLVSMGYRLGIVLNLPTFRGKDGVTSLPKALSVFGKAPFNDAIDITSFLEFFWGGVYIREPGHEDIFQASGVLCFIY
jgi:hypothetical protein